MIYFFADDHYQSYPGRTIREHLGNDYEIKFYENDWSVLSAPDGLHDCSLLILNMIADTCGNPVPDALAEKNVRSYCERGGRLLLLHGSSAAFWPWAWWRQLVGWRWVRGNDPDGVTASTHPTRPYAVTVAKSRHPLCSRLQNMNLPADEIYIRLEQVGPAWTIMETTTEEGTFPQVYETVTPWGGRLIGFIPGHAPAVTADPVLLANLRETINYLLNAGLTQ